MSSRRRQIHLKHRGRLNARARKLGRYIPGPAGVYFSRESIIRVLNDCFRDRLPDGELLTYQSGNAEIRRAVSGLSALFPGGALMRIP